MKPIRIAIFSGEILRTLQSCRAYWRLRKTNWLGVSVVIPALWFVFAPPPSQAISFVHQADASNTSRNYTQVPSFELESNGGLIVFATARRSGPNNPSVSAPIGVWFSGSTWRVFTEDQSPMPIGADFNVMAMRPGRKAFVHTALVPNIQANVTQIDRPELNGNPKASLMVGQVYGPDGNSGVYNPHPIGVFYNGSRWSVFNEDLAPMPTGAAFSVAIGDGKTLTKEKDDLSTMETDPKRVIIVTQNWNPVGHASVYNGTEVGVSFKDGEWFIESMGRMEIVSGASFNVLSLPVNGVSTTTTVVSPPAVIAEQLNAESERRIRTTIHTDVNLSSTDSDSVSARLAVSNSSVYVAWREQTDPGNEIRFVSSLDNGRSFSGVKVLSRPGISAVAPEVIAFGNTVFVFYLAERDVWCRRSNDGGRVFGPQINISESPEVDSFDLNVATDGNSVFVVWAEHRTETTDMVNRKFLMFRRIDNSGMAAPSAVGTGNDSEPKLAVRGTRVVLTFATARPEGDVDTHIAMSDDRGNNWKLDESPLWGNFGNQQFAQPYILPSGNVQFTYESRPPGSVQAILEDLGSAQRSPISFNRRQNVLNGRSLSTGVTGLVEGNRDPMVLAGAVVGNELVMSWTQFDGRRRSLYLARSGRPIEVLNTEGVDPRNPSMAATGGNLAIVCAERSSPGVPEEIHLVRISPVFSIINLSESPGRSLDAQIAITNGFIFVVWIDDTPGRFDVFFRAVPIGG